LGASLETLALDLTDADAVATFIAGRARSQRPIAGIVHGAAVFRDGLLGQLDEQSIRAVLRPKMAGAWALHRALAKSGVELDFFLSLSSVAQVLGSLGQANYVAANSFLEGFSAYRAAQGLAAQVVNLGALAEAGFVAENAAMGSYLDSLGILPMSTAETLDLLDGLTASSATSRCLAAVDWGRVQSASGRAGVTPRLAGLMPGSRKGDQKLRQLLEGMPVANWAATLEDFLVAEVSRVLDVDQQLVPINRPLAELGLDSLSSIELKNRIESKLALSLTVGAFLQAPTLEKLASVIAATLEQQTSSERHTGAGSQAARLAGPTTSYLPLQHWAMRLALAPMTSAAGRGVLEQTAQRDLASGISLGELSDRLARIGGTGELSLLWSPDSGGLVQGAQARIAVVSNLDEAISRPLALEDGELVRIVAVERDGVVTQLGIRLQLAVAVEPASVIDALERGDTGLIRRACAAAVDQDPIAAEANSRALLEPWIAAPQLPGASLAVTGCLGGLNIGGSAYLPVLETTETVLEAEGLLAFARAVGSLVDQGAVMVERFSGPLAHSVPIRAELDPDRSRALATIQHQLSLTSRLLDVCAMELQLVDQLDAADVRARQFGFSQRSDKDPVPPAWNALALHVVTFEGVTSIGLAFDPLAIDETAVETVAALFRQYLGQGNSPARPTGKQTVPRPARTKVLPDVRVAAAAAAEPAAGYPVTPTLANLLDGVSDPAASATLRRASLMCQAIRIRPGLDVPRLQRAVRKLVDRHDFLRSHFTQHDGHWRVETDDAGADLSVIDMSGAGNVEIEKEARALASRPYDPGRPPLVEFHLLRQGQGGDVLMVRLFEGIADGWSVGLILDELLKAYLGLDLGPRPPGLAQILRLAGTTSKAGVTRVAGIDRLKLGPNRIRTIRLNGVDALRQLARPMGTTENGLLAAAFALALGEAGHQQAGIGTYDPARTDPQLHRAVAFLSRLVMLDLPEGDDVTRLARALDAQFLDLGAKPEIVGHAPEFIYAPVLPRHMLDQSLFGPAMRRISKGRVSMMSMEVETLDIAPTGLQEGRLQLRPLPIDGRLDLRLHYDIANYSDADVAALGRRIVALAGVSPSIVDGESLSEIIGSEEGLALGAR
jgi:acyl carrier protein